jgi:hypothetical protein
MVQKPHFLPIQGGGSKMDHIWFVDFHLFLGISGMEITNFNIVLTIGPSYREIQASKSPKSLKIQQK